MQADKGRIQSDWYNPKEFIIENYSNQDNLNSKRGNIRSVDYRNIMSKQERGSENPNEGRGLASSLVEYFKTAFNKVSE